MAAEGVQEVRRVQGRGGGGRGPGRGAAGGAVATVPVGGRAHGNPGPSALTLLESAGLLQIVVAGKPRETRATIGHRITSPRSPVAGEGPREGLSDWTGTSDRSIELIFSSLSFGWVVKQINCARTARPCSPELCDPPPRIFPAPLPLGSGLWLGNEEPCRDRVVEIVFDRKLRQQAGIESWRRGDGAPGITKPLDNRDYR
jgi:hypothetical protein